MISQQPGARGLVSLNVAGLVAAAGCRYTGRQGFGRAVRLHVSYSKVEGGYETQISYS